MDIYFVRHGQTDGNVGTRHQHPDTELNEIGKQQAAAVAPQVAALLPTHIISSVNIRALETARHIAEYTGLIPITSATFEELRRPEYLIGERFYAWRSLRYVIAWFFRLRGMIAHDGETYDALLARIKKAQGEILALPSDARVVVVSHSVFINFFIEHMNNGKPMRPWRSVYRFYRLLRTRNTSITHLTYVEGRCCRWRLEKVL
jgi:broad specificity phosphatase PhoE